MHTHDLEPLASPFSRPHREDGLLLRAQRHAFAGGCCSLMGRVTVFLPLLPRWVRRAGKEPLGQHGRGWPRENTAVLTWPTAWLLPALLMRVLGTPGAFAVASGDKGRKSVGTPEGPE